MTEAHQLLRDLRRRVLNRELTPQHRAALMRFQKLLEEDLGVGAQGAD